MIVSPVGEIKVVHDGGFGWDVVLIKSGSLYDLEFLVNNQLKKRHIISGRFTIVAERGVHYDDR